MTKRLMLTAAVLGLLLAAVPAAAGPVAAEFEVGDGMGDGQPKPPVQIPPRAELDKLVVALGVRGRASTEAQDALTEYLKADQNRVVLAALQQGLASGPPLQRVMVIYCLQNSGKPEGMELIANCLEDQDAFVRRAAVSAVSNSKTVAPEQVALMRQYISSDDEVVRREAVLAAGRLKDTEALPLLVEMVEAGSAGCRAEVLWALREITGRDFGANQAAWESWYEFYEKEVLAARMGGGSAAESPGREPRPIPQPEGSGNAYTASIGGAEPETASTVPWGAILAGLAVLLIVGGWLGCRLWLAAAMRKVLAMDQSARSASLIASRFSASDSMPGFIVYPFLMGCISMGSPNRVGVALHVLMFRLHGGCRSAAQRSGRLPQQKPIPGGRDVVLKLPRDLLRDMALVGNPAGRCLVRIAEPDNLSWSRDPEDREVQIARKHLAARPQSDN